MIRKPPFAAGGQLRSPPTAGALGLIAGQGYNKHVTRHYYKTQHPIVQSPEPGEHWWWCYADNMLME